jgi:methyltransferase (TIGR00027 family)
MGARLHEMGAWLHETGAWLGEMGAWLHEMGAWLGERGVRRGPRGAWPFAFSSLPGSGYKPLVDGPSTTATMVAAYRGRASARPDPVCSDPWALRLAGEDGVEVARRYDGAFPHMELWIALRTAFIDDRVRRAIRPEGEMSQVVVLGAGLDTRAARLGRPGDSGDRRAPKVRFFEVDREETQTIKLARLATFSDYPKACATYVTCDFEREDFLERLVAEGFSTEEPAFFVWEGVTAYLSEAAVRATLRRIASGAHPRSVVVFDHLRRKIVSGDVKDPKDQESRTFVADLGEPLRFGIDYPLPLLYEEGFRRVRMVNFDEIGLEVTGSYERQRAFRFQGVVLGSRETKVL